MYEQDPQPGPAPIDYRPFILLGGLAVLVGVAALICMRSISASSASPSLAAPPVSFGQSPAGDLPEDVAALLAEGEAAMGEGDLAGALAAFGRVIELDPQQADAYLNRGMVYVAQGQFEAAIADFERMMAVAPDDARAWLGRGIAYYLQKEYPAAIADFERYLEMEPEAPERAEIEQVIAEMQAALGTPAP